jgi:hypothetical protein
MCAVVHDTYQYAFFVFAGIAVFAFFALLSTSRFEILFGRWQLTLILIMMAAICFLIIYFTPSYLNNTCHIPTSYW